MSSTSGTSGSGSSGSGSGGGGMNPSHSVFYQIRKHQDENNNTSQRQVSFLSKQHSRHKSPPHHTDSHQSSSSQIYLEMLQHIHDDLLRDIYNSTSSSSSSGTSTTNGDITNDSSTTANNTCRE
ncbi:hypothetical protein C9374_007719 [Naegleria lovaniensis]|uniref:Uncharacterized protein n=1 Tax=Naegleria lovaniensis TaxID=51637 RepID=A0AA88GL09_NAELO|nr:uncharacterized protein C9374_007719 [Naegleria lovaniensis]KAG2379081.1 hypothetical protein C9374_007719 [Naegleria lovaniensis]